MNLELISDIDIFIEDGSTIILFNPDGSHHSHHSLRDRRQPPLT